MRADNHNSLYLLSFSECKKDLGKYARRINVLKVLFLIAARALACGYFAIRSAVSCDDAYLLVQ
jgi:hypothetical protein